MVEAAAGTENISARLPHKIRETGLQGGVRPRRQNVYRTPERAVAEKRGKADTQKICHHLPRSNRETGAEKRCLVVTDCVGATYFKR